MDLALLTGRRPADVLKLKRTDIRDGALWIVQNKTGTRLGVEFTGELASVINRINERPRRAIGPYLVQDGSGQPLSQFALRSRFDKARTAAGWIFSSELFEPSQPPTQATSRILNPCWATRIET